MTQAVYTNLPEVGLGKVQIINSKNYFFNIGVLFL